MDLLKVFEPLKCWRKMFSIIFAPTNCVLLKYSKYPFYIIFLLLEGKILLRI